MTDLDKAREALTGVRTCVLVKENSCYLSEKKGIAPMLEYIGQNTDLQGYAVADRIVGRAAAMLFVKAGIAAVYAQVLSVSGRQFLEQKGIPVYWSVLTETIQNRQGTGSCPMEETVAGLDDAEEGYIALVKKAAALRAAALSKADFSS